MIEYLTLTIVSAIGIGAYLYHQMNASIQVGFFTGVLIGSSFAEDDVMAEDENGDEKEMRICSLQFSIICLMVTFIWAGE
tara:strand:+ start:4469 stop:4708 length:240 start_codon:yes stop_codon:yes gene_type:complete